MKRRRYRRKSDDVTVFLSIPDVFVSCALSVLAEPIAPLQQTIESP